MIFIWILFLSAFSISAIAGWFSIAGLIAIFPGAPIAVGLMGASLELGKLVSASWLYRSWDIANKLMRTYFIAAVFVLSFITSIGIFGYLTRSHVEGSQGLNANAEQIALIDEQIKTERDNIATAKVSQQQLDNAVSAVVAERAVRIRRSQQKDRQAIATSIAESNKKIVALQTQRAEMNKGQRQLETEVGPIKYVAQMIYNTDDAQTLDKAVRVLTLMLVFVFDPLAILLVIAANMQIAERKKLNPIMKFPAPDKVAEIEDEWNLKMVTKPTKTDG